MLHKHDATDEGFFVVAGILEAQLGEKRVQAPAGSFVWVPGGIAHAFANAGPEPLHVLALALPGGIEALFAEQAAYFASLDGPPDVELLSEIGERHGAPTLGLQSVPVTRLARRSHRDMARVDHDALADRKAAMRGDMDGLWMRTLARRTRGAPGYGCTP